ncbi:MAG: hypothetical protein ABI761_11215 [Saprospiraceae bacterium]
MVQKISSLFCAIGFLFPVLSFSQKNAEFESGFTMTNSMGKSVNFTIGFDRNAIEWYEDTIWGEKNLYRPNQDMLFRDSFDIILHPLNVWSYDKSIIQSKNCGEYEYGPLQLIVRVNSYMFPLILKWINSDFSGFCVSRSVFEPSIMGPLMGDYSDIVLLRNLDSLVITNEMAKNVSLYTYLGSNNVDTIRYMNFLFRPQSASIKENEEKTIPRIVYRSGAFILKNTENYSEMSIYSLNGAIINKFKLPKLNYGEITIPWTPPNESIFIINLNGKGISKTVKLYCGAGR